MKSVQCDGCLTTVVSESLLGTPPDGWYTVSTRGLPDRHYCDLACLVGALTEDLAAQQQPYLKEGA